MFCCLPLYNFISNIILHKFIKIFGTVCPNLLLYIYTLIDRHFKLKVSEMECIILLHPFLNQCFLLVTQDWNIRISIKFFWFSHPSKPINNKAQLPLRSMCLKKYHLLSISLTKVMIQVPTIACQVLCHPPKWIVFLLSVTPLSSLSSKTWVNGFQMQMTPNGCRFHQLQFRYKNYSSFLFFFCFYCFCFLITLTLHCSLWQNWGAWGFSYHILSFLFFWMISLSKASWPG